MKNRFCNHPTCTHSYFGGYRLYRTSRGYICLEHLTPEEAGILKVRTNRSPMRPRSVGYIYNEKDHETL